MILDVLIAGGGPAGLAAALAAHRAGLTAVVLEPRPFPVDKACGEGLLPAAVAQLDRWGIRPTGKDFHGIRYTDGSSDATARFRGGAALAVRRTVLQRALADAVTAVGVEIVPSTADVPRQDGTSVRCAGWQARYLIAADGLHSTIARSLGLDQPTPGRRRWGQRAHFAVTTGDLVEVHWSPSAEAYLTPVADDVLGVAVLTSRRAGFDELLDGFGELRDRLAGARRLTAVAGAGPLRRRTSRRVAGRVLLVGDAAGYLDALTGEGVGLALLTAAEAVRCIASGRPEDYERRWRSITRAHRWGTTALLGAAGSSWARQQIVPAAQRFPRTFSRLVNLL